VPYKAKEVREKIKKAKIQEQANRRRTMMIRPSDKENKPTNGVETPVKMEALKARRTSLVSGSSVRNSLVRQQPASSVPASPAKEDETSSKEDAEAASSAASVSSVSSAAPSFSPSPVAALPSMRVAKRVAKLKVLPLSSAAVISKQASLINSEPRGTNAYSTRAKQLTEEMSTIVEGLEQERNELSLRLGKIRAACQAALEQDEDSAIASQILALIGGSSAE